MTRSRLHMCCCNDTDRILIVTFWEKVVYMYCRCTVTILLIIGFTDYKNVGKIIMVYTLKIGQFSSRNPDERSVSSFLWMEYFFEEMHFFNLCSINMQSLIRKTIRLYRYPLRWWLKLLSSTNGRFSWSNVF
jgi:hypothetical protein